MTWWEWGRRGGGGRGEERRDCTVQNFGPICIIKSKMNQIRRKGLTFHKNQQPTPRIYKKVAASRRQPALLAGGYASPLQLQDRRPDRLLLADSRHRRRRRHTSRTDTTDHSTYHHQIPTPATDSRNHAITNHQETTTPPPSPESSPSKKPRTKSPARNTAPTQYFHVNIEEEYPIHEKYELQM